MRISDWSSDVCSSDLFVGDGGQLGFVELAQVGRGFNARKARVARGVDHVRHFPLRRRDGQGKGTFRTWECPQVRRTTWQRAGDCAESAPERAGYLPRRRPNRPVGFAGSAGSGGVFGALSAKPVDRLALTKAATLAIGLPLAPAHSARGAGPFRSEE